MRRSSILAILATIALLGSAPSATLASPSQALEGISIRVTIDPEMTKIGETIAALLTKAGATAQLHEKGNCSGDRLVYATQRSGSRGKAQRVASYLGASVQTDLDGASQYDVVLYFSRENCP